MMTGFDPAADYVLEDDRVLLRPLKEGDYEHLLWLAENEPGIWKYSLLQAGSADLLRAYLELAMTAKAEQKEYPFIVYDKQSGAYAGSTRFYDLQLKQKCLQLGYTWYGTSFQGTGLNKHCKFLLLQFAFEQMGMERVEFRADSRNEKSIAAMKSIGCTVEGMLRSNGFTAEGMRRDSVVLSILKPEWYGHVKDNLAAKLS